MASSAFRSLASGLSRSVAHRPLASSSKLAAISTRRAASTSVSPVDEPPQIVPTAGDMEKDPQLAGLGYPQLDQTSRQLRPALANWWDRQERVNYGEVLPEKDDTLSMWAPDVHKMPASKAFAQLALMSGVMATFAAFIYAVQTEAPATRRTYPYDGLVKELSGTDDQVYAAIPKQAKSGTGEEEEEDEE